ncbi:serine/threonine-protein kinase [Enhygromyxa salina]|nr:serine/threonine-protein kinase [Enhygromyxa salina]
MDSDPGDAKQLSVVGRYVILESIGMGGMGMVCAAYDPKLNRKIALKLLRNTATDEASTAGRNRLFREAQALAKLSHPNVVTVHDVDVFEGQVYIAMEFVEGSTLRDWLGEQPRTWQEILAKFVLAGRGIAAAHQADIIHRDFKPSNVLISVDGDVRVADFGVAKEHERQINAERDRQEFERRRHTASSGSGFDSTTTAEHALIDEIQSNISMDLTVAGRMVGTPAYMAPEQHMGLRVGPYTDQYSFCVSFYEALYGRLPFEGTDRRDQLAKMAGGKPPQPPKEANTRNVPNWLFKVLARGLSAHPTERWPSMEAMLAALDRDPAKRVRRFAALGVGVVGLATGLLGLAFGFGNTEDQVSHCPALAQDIERHWNADRRADVEDAFSASSKPFADDAARRAISRLDGWSAVWGQSRVEICEATWVGEQSDELLDVRMYCLEQRARELDAMVDLFVEADDEIVERAVSAVHALSDPRACALVRETGEIDDRQLDNIAREQISQMELDLNRAFALASAEKYEESLPLQERVVARARELPHPRTLSRALYDQSQSQFETGKFELGEASLREGIELAAQLGDVEQEARAWIRLIFYLGSQQHRFAEGHAWTLAAGSALVRAGGSPKLEIPFEGAVAALELAEGHFEPAVEHFGRALNLARQEYGEIHPITIRIMMNYGSSVARIDAPKGEAEAVLLETVSRSKDAYGPNHPHLATAYYNLGNVYWVTDQTDKAEPAFRETLRIREQIGGPDAPNLANPLHALARIARNASRLEQALADFERVLVIHTKTKGENSREVAAAHTDIGVTQQELGRFEDARASFDQAGVVYAKIYPDGHRHIGGLEKRRCNLFVEAQLWAEAVDACERALAIAARFEAEPEIEREVYELIVAAERGRGRIGAAERAQQRVDALTAAIQ